jgi:hypothetical protein
MTDVLFADPRDTNPPQELTWDSTLKDLLSASYNFSDDLIDPANPPRFIRMFADRWQANWQLSGVDEPIDQTVVDIFITVRPVAPATITIKV